MAGLTTLEKGLNILSLFDKDHPVMSIPEIAARLNLPESTSYRYVATLKSQRLIEEDTKPGYYRLGLKILESAQVVKQQSIINSSFPIMEQLSNQTGEIVMLAGIYDQKGICLEKVESHHNLRVSFERGATFYLHAGATGKTLMAYLDEKEQDSIIKEIGLPKFTENTTIDPEKLKVELKRIREDGFAVSDGEVHQGVRAIAAPIFNGRGKMIADLSVGAPIHRLEGSRKEETIRLVIDTARKITEQMSVYEG
ncbi:MAG: IclR family transcriptional regulator [Candidatus Latescibacteria bacterium]|nr:IclR family transcriptional regulator [Candidatus Latescibacterota bacterium]